MKLSIIIVSWNTRELVLKCLKSIFSYLKNISFDVYLVDNNSTDSTVEEVEKYKAENNLENLHIIANKKNVGFARANNQAITLCCHSYASQDLEIKEGNSWIPNPASLADKQVGDDKNGYFLLLNPDTELIDDSLIKMIEFAKTNPDIVIVGPKLLNIDLSLQKSCRQFPKLLDQLLIQLKFYNFWPEKFKATREYFMLDFDYDSSGEVEQVMGAAMLIKKSVFDKIGLLDENFWAIFEEVDFCQRAKDVGYKIYYFANTKIVHHKEQSFGQWKKLRKQINFNHSLYYYFKKHKPIWQLFILWLVQPINLFLTLVDMLIGVRHFFGKSKDL
ncbi:MAG TPA: glycosyltransferase family 2 protein [bacterium]|nr:glycosyltransferase family 2 protein [bacterium]